MIFLVFSFSLAGARSLSPHLNLTIFLSSLSPFSALLSLFHLLLTSHYTSGQAPTGESVADLSGGGFSNYFERPSYQDDAVAHYTKQGGASLPDQKMWNATGKEFNFCFWLVP